jgi:hypothetical protein
VFASTRRLLHARSSAFKPDPVTREGAEHVHQPDQRELVQTYGIRLLAGRDFATADRTGTPVAIVNEVFAKKFTPGRSPIGARIRQPGFGPRPTIDREIVGFVKDAVYRSLRDPVPPTMYLLLDQQPEPPSSMSVSVRAAAGSPILLSRPLAASIAAVRPDIAITLRPLADQGAGDSPLGRGQ